MAFACRYCLCRNEPPMNYDYLPRSGNRVLRSRWQFRLRTLLILTTVCAVGMSCYRYYADHREVWRYQGMLKEKFVKFPTAYGTRPEECDILMCLAQSEEGRSVLDALGVNSPFWGLNHSLRAVNARSEALRVYVFEESTEDWKVLSGPICVITDDSKRVLYWRTIKDLRALQVERPRSPLMETSSC